MLQPQKQYEFIRCLTIMLKNHMNSYVVLKHDRKPYEFIWFLRLHHIFFPPYYCWSLLFLLWILWFAFRLCSFVFGRVFNVYIIR